MQAHPQTGLIEGLVVHQDSTSTSPGKSAYVQWQNSLFTPEDCALHRFVECPLAHPTSMHRVDNG
jgi:hypothetical protein